MRKLLLQKDIKRSENFFPDLQLKIKVEKHENVTHILQKLNICVHSERSLLTG